MPQEQSCRKFRRVATAEGEWEEEGEKAGATLQLGAPDAAR
jgi:hypothetical protein